MKLLIKFAALFSIIVLSACNGNNNSSIEESGTIETTNSVVSSQVMGEVDAILFDEGDFVKKGDTVLVIDHENYDIQLNQLRATQNAAKAQLDLILNGARKEDIKLAEEKLKQAELSYESAEKDKDRFEKLYQLKAITKKQYDDINTKFDIAFSQLNSARENLNKMKNIARPEEIKQAQANYEKTVAANEQINKSIHDCYVTAPFDGFIVKRFVEKGEMLSMLTSLFKISDLSMVKLVVYISEENLGKVKLSQTAEITTDSYPNKTYEGKVIYISPEAEFTPKNIQTKDERTKLVFAVKIEIPNPDFELKAGMPADAKIIF
jgi:HlyD family secretion protein